MSRSFESLGQYHDFWAWLLLSAPDRFTSVHGSPVDQQVELRAAFQVLRDWFHLAERKFKNPRLVGVLRELLAMSEEAYASGDKKRGAHVLQECEGLIWPSRLQKQKYVVEAEKRAFGDLELFKGIFVSRYPYEGTIADLGEGQRALLDLASQECEAKFRLEEDFKWLLWIRDADGRISRGKPKSWRKAEEHLRSGFGSGTISAYIKADLSFGGRGGLLSFMLEEPSRPLVNAVAIMRNWQHDPLRFHLNDPYLTDDSWLRVKDN